MSNDNINQHNKMQREFANKYPEIVSEINVIIDKIANIISRLPPEHLLSRASKEFMLKNVGIQAESEGMHEQTHSFRMIDYLQSVIVSVKPIFPQSTEISENTWVELKTLVDDLFNTINLKYQIYRTAYNKINDINYDDNWEEFSYMVLRVRTIEMLDGAL